MEKKIIDVEPDRTVAIIEGAFVTINQKNPLNDDPYDYSSVRLTIEQLRMIARQV